VSDKTASFLFSHLLMIAVSGSGGKETSTCGEEPSNYQKPTSIEPSQTSAAINMTLRLSGEVITEGPLVVQI
jgi:hypothetical protein